MRLCVKGWGWRVCAGFGCCANLFELYVNVWVGTIAVLYRANRHSVFLYIFFYLCEENNCSFYWKRRGKRSCAFSLKSVSEITGSKMYYKPIESSTI